MILNTITSDAVSSSDVTVKGADFALELLCSRLGVLSVKAANRQRFGKEQYSLQQARALCDIQGHSPWRSSHAQQLLQQLCSDSKGHTISLLLSFLMQRKNPSFSLSRKILNEKGSRQPIRQALGEVIQRKFAAASDVEALPSTG